MNVRLTFIAVFFLLISVIKIAGASDDPGQKPVTMADALKLGAEELTQITGPSEVGQDHAAYLYATAKRVETEHVLAQKNVQLVIELHHWREAISKARGSAYTLSYVINGGGTMYTHGHARDCASVEDFLADLAKRLPLPEGKGDKKAVKVIDDAIALINKLQPLDVGDAKSQKKAKADLAAEVTRVTEFWTSLKYMIEQVPAEEANKIAAFAAGTLEWLREG